MIVTTAIINLIQETGENTVKDIELPMPGNNISGPLAGLVNKEIIGSNPFILGASKFIESPRAYDSVPYYIGSVPASNTMDSNFAYPFSTPYVITIYNNVNKSTIAGDMTSFTMIFDKYNNQYPITINVDGTDYSNDDAQFTVTGLTGSRHIITINNWSNANFPLRLQGVFAKLDIDIDNTNLVSLERNLFDRSDNVKPEYGIISNTGSLVFNDNYGEIKEYAQQKLLKSDLDVGMYIENTLNNKKEKIATFKTKKWDYDNYNFNISVSLKDDLLEWQDILIDEMPLNGGMNMENLYKYLYNLTPSKYGMPDFSSLTDYTKSILSGTYCQHAYLNKDNLWNQWRKLCETCALYIYESADGSISCDSDIRS